MNYKSSGVDVEAGRSFVSLISQKVKSTHRPEVVGGFGGFNGMTRIPAGYEKPILVSGSDGVGTKLNIAQIYNTDDAHYGVGIDLVAMCVNDVITCGADPLFFLDYISTVKLDPNALKHVIFGIGDGCHTSGCSLLGGETAEHPGPIPTPGTKYDLAGFCVGVVEEDNIIDGSRIKPGDQIIGVESSGVHSNGYSLINALLYQHKFYLKDVPELLTPTTIYAPLVKQLKEEVDILGMAHITGGGIPENLPRCLPSGLIADVDYWSWERPEVFNKIEKAGDIEEKEMRNVYNLGIGYCVVVSNSEVDNTQSIIERNGLKSWVIGTCIQS